MALIVDIKVVPNSGKQLCMLDKTGKLKCYLKSPPERNLANNELISMFAKALKIPQNDVSLVAGAASRTKKIKINQAITHDVLLSKLGIVRQLQINDKE